MRRFAALVGAGLLTIVALPAEAFELRAGLSLGGIVVGTAPRFAVSPHAGMAWRKESGFMFAVHDICSILPTTKNVGIGVYNQTSAAIGFASDKVDFSMGPSISIYSMDACGVTLCGRVVGLAPGGHAQVNLYVAGRLGVSVRANVDWVGGQSLVLPGGVAAMLVAGPVLRWSSK
jgi:hypothetical protein